MRYVYACWQIYLFCFVVVNIVLMCRRTYRTLLTTIPLSACSRLMYSNPNGGAARVNNLCSTADGLLTRTRHRVKWWFCVHSLCVVWDLTRVFSVHWRWRLRQFVVFLKIPKKKRLASSRVVHSYRLSDKSVPGERQYETHKRVFTSLYVPWNYNTLKRCQKVELRTVFWNTAREFQ